MSDKSTPTTTIDLDTLAKLEREATPGPWETSDGSVTRQIGTSAKWVAEAKGWAGDGHREFPQTKDLAANDAALIAALRNAARELIEAARERDALRALLSRVETDYCTPLGNVEAQRTGERVVLMQDIRAALSSAPSKPACATCGGKGKVWRSCEGGMQLETLPCPDCATERGGR